MFKEVISKKTQSNLEILKKAGLIAGFYLAGGTGAALHLGHRLSADADFFSRKKFALVHCRNFNGSHHFCSRYTALGC